LQGLIKLGGGKQPLGLEGVGKTNTESKVPRLYREGKERSQNYDRRAPTQISARLKIERTMRGKRKKLQEVLKRKGIESVYNSKTGMEEKCKGIEKQHLTDEQRLKKPTRNHENYLRPKTGAEKRTHQ